VIRRKAAKQQASAKQRDREEVLAAGGNPYEIERRKQQQARIKRELENRVIVRYEREEKLSKDLQQGKVHRGTVV